MSRTRSTPTLPGKNPGAGFTTHPAAQVGEKLRVRAETFMDHYSQARLFYHSMTPPEQDHIVNAFAFELGKVATPEIRCRVLGHIKNVDAELCGRVEQALGMEGQAYLIPPAVEPIDMEPSPALSLLGKAKPTLEGRKIGVLVSEGYDLAVLDQLQAAAEAEGAAVELIGPHIGEVKSNSHVVLVPRHAIAGAPSVLFDSVVLAVSEAGAESLCKQAAVMNFIRDAYAHLKIIGYTASSMALLERAEVGLDEGVIEMETSDGTFAYIEAAKQGRLWTRASVIQA